MARTPRDKLERERDKVRNLADDGTISPACRDALLDWTDALDEKTVRRKYHDADGNVKTLRPNTVTDYLTCLRITCESGVDLLETTAESFNDCMDRMHDDEGKSQGRLVSYQCAAQTFYRYHDLGIDPDDITVYNPDSSPRHDEMDMFEEGEVTALRQACAETKMPVRNRALLELLVFTGQRITALVTLRRGDVDLQDGYIYLNDDYDEEFGGLKGALVRGRKRPMFGATKYVRDYIDYHRADAQPDDWLFVGDPTHWRTSEGDHWARRSAEGALERIAETADIDKPVNPHNFRHYCATVLYRDYDVDMETIGMLFGHVEGSNTLKETYSHLFDEDFIAKAEQKLGFGGDDEGSSTFTPDVCPTCGEVLEDHWRRCPSCDEVFGPTDDFEERLGDVRERARDEGMASLDPDTVQVAQAISNAGADPVALAETLAALDD